ncbi:hypothetical protein [Sutcliffiella deserti]|uniref:hypothetical protein n=1 Tax=Sutcliffiella deserti TaxID=2875501 RepID=UPI001CBF76CF|nr:hypothetical protein [Sutcliffiella deserti]
MMNLGKNIIIPFTLGIGMIIFLTLWILSERDNQSYERYLSEELVNQVVQISSAPPYALSILQDVIEKGEITQVQAGELESNFYYLAFVTQDISQMDIYLNRLGDYNHNQIVSINNDYREFFMFLKRDMESNEAALTTEQLEELQLMERLMQHYSKVVEDTLMFTGDGDTNGQPSEFFDYYSEQGIKDDYWVDLLKGYERVTDFSYSIN